MQPNSQDFWDKKHDKYATQDWITKPTIFATEAIRFFPKNGKILELGCGQGADSIHFAKNGYEVLATDFSPNAIELAKKQTPAELKDKIHYSVEDIKQPLNSGQSFDIIYSHLSLHFFDQERTMKLFDEIYQLLKPSGIFATIVNSLNDPETKVFKPIGPEYFEDAEGQTKRYFSVESLSKLTSKYKTLLLDDKGETWKDKMKGVHGLIRFVGQKI